jgi:hypothetical protein
MAKHGEKRRWPDVPTRSHGRTRSRSPWGPGDYPEEHLAPYKEFEIGAKTYYFTPGGFLYRKDPGTEEVGGYFCGYLTDEVWNHRTDDG